jgi:hypothetical protein
MGELRLALIQQFSVPWDWIIDDTYEVLPSTANDWDCGWMPNEFLGLELELHLTTVALKLACLFLSHSPKSPIILPQWPVDVEVDRQQRHLIVALIHRIGWCLEGDVRLLKVRRASEDWGLEAVKYRRSKALMESLGAESSAKLPWGKSLSLSSLSGKLREQG